ncbi:hypothetical protein HRbin36_00101 [bacterium HR36]|nr:hypothetical protein HRbin36_00101 [bacterium HR36]
MLSIRTYSRLYDIPSLTDWDKLRQGNGRWRVSESILWMEIARNALGHRPYYVTAWEGELLAGALAFAEIRSYIFGSFLVSMPYVNWGGPVAANHQVKSALLEAAIQLAELRRVDYLEIRADLDTTDARWVKRSGQKVIMLLDLSSSEGQLWQRLGSKVRNQVRKAQKLSMNLICGGKQLADDFCNIYSSNMQYLGTPTYPATFVATIAECFRDRCEIVLVSQGKRPVAGAVLLHGNGISEVPLAACLPEYRSSCASMLLYWELLRRSIERGSLVFDFGRCTKDSGSYHFKKQWGARAQELVWYYYIRRTDPATMAKEHPRFRVWQSIWKWLPQYLAQLLGSYIVRGIPV